MRPCIGGTPTSTLWKYLIGLPDAILYTAAQAFSGGVFTKLLGLLFVVMFVSMLGRWWLPGVFLVPFAVSLIGWFLLLMAHGADALFGHLLLAPAIPTVATAASVGVHAYGLARTTFGLTQHGVAHKMTRHIAGV